jgi:hypothetical protein
MNITKYPSANFNVGRSGYKPEYYVLHKTLGYENGDLTTLTKKGTGVSAHFHISRDGDVRQLVDVANTAWHAGIISSPNPRGKAILKKYPSGSYVNPNLYTIGIELEGLAAATYTDVQMDMLVELLCFLEKETGVPADEKHIITHRDITAYKPNIDGYRERALTLLSTGTPVQDKKVLLFIDRQENEKDAAVVSAAIAAANFPPCVKIVSSGEYHIYLRVISVAGRQGGGMAIGETNQYTKQYHGTVEVGEEFFPLVAGSSKLFTSGTVLQILRHEAIEHPFAKELLGSAIHGDTRFDEMSRDETWEYMVRTINSQYDPAKHFLQFNGEVAQSDPQKDMQGYFVMVPGRNVDQALVLGDAKILVPDGETKDFIIRLQIATGEMRTIDSGAYDTLRDLGTFPSKKVHEKVGSIFPELLDAYGVDKK